MIVCGKHHVYCLYDCVETSLSDCSTLYWKQQNIYSWYLKIDNSAVRQYFQMKFCAYFTEYFRIKHTKIYTGCIQVSHFCGTLCWVYFFRTQCTIISHSSYNHRFYTVITRYIHVLTALVCLADKNYDIMNY